VHVVGIYSYFIIIVQCKVQNITFVYTCSPEKQLAEVYITFIYIIKLYIYDENLVSIQINIYIYVRAHSRVIYQSTLIIERVTCFVKILSLTQLLSTMH